MCAGASLKQMDSRESPRTRAKLMKSIAQLERNLFAEVEHKAANSAENPYYTPWSPDPDTVYPIDYRSDEHTGDYSQDYRTSEHTPGANATDYRTSEHTVVHDPRSDEHRYEADPRVYYGEFNRVQPENSLILSELLKRVIQAWNWQENPDATYPYAPDPRTDEHTGDTSTDYRTSEHTGNFSTDYRSSEHTGNFSTDYRPTEYQHPDYIDLNKDPNNWNWQENPNATWPYNHDSRTDEHTGNWSTDYRPDEYKHPNYTLITGDFDPTILENLLEKIYKDWESWTPDPSKTYAHEGGDPRGYQHYANANAPDTRSSVITHPEYDSRDPTIHHPEYDSRDPTIHHPEYDSRDPTIHDPEYDSRDPTIHDPDYDPRVLNDLLEDIYRDWLHWEPNPNRTVWEGSNPNITYAPDYRADASKGVYAPEVRSAEHTGEEATDYRSNEHTGEEATDYRSSEHTGEEATDYRSSVITDPEYDPRVLGALLAKIVENWDWQPDPNERYPADVRSSEHTGEDATDYRTSEHTGDEATDYRSSEHTGENATDYRTSEHTGDYATDQRSSEHTGENATDYRTSEHTDTAYDPREIVYALTAVQKSYNSVPASYKNPQLMLERMVKAYESDDPKVWNWQPNPNVTWPYNADSRTDEHTGNYSTDYRPDEYKHPDYVLAEVFKVVTNEYTSQDDPRVLEELLLRIVDTWNWQPDSGRSYYRDMRSEEHTGEKAPDRRSPEHTGEHATDYRTSEHTGEHATDYRTSEHTGEHATDYRSAEHTGEEATDYRSAEHTDDSYDPRVLSFQANDNKWDWQPDPTVRYGPDYRSDEHTGDTATDYRSDEHTGEYATDYRSDEHTGENATDYRSEEHTGEYAIDHRSTEHVGELPPAADDAAEFARGEWTANPDRDYAEDPRSSEHQGEYATDYRTDEHTGNYSKDYRSSEHVTDDYDPRVFTNPTYNPRIYEEFVAGDDDYVPWVPDARYEYAPDPRSTEHTGDYATDQRDAHHTGVYAPDTRSIEHKDLYYDPRPDGFGETDTLPDPRVINNNDYTPDLLLRTRSREEPYTPWAGSSDYTYAPDPRPAYNKGDYAADPRPQETNHIGYDPRTNEHRHDTDRRSAEHVNQGIDGRTAEHREETDRRSSEHRGDGSDMRSEIHRYVHDPRTSEHRNGPY